MRRLVPHPVLSLALVLVWLLMTRFSLGHLLLGGAISLVAGWALGALEPEAPRIRRVLPFVRLMGIVGIDIIRSNIAVAMLILTRGRHGERKSGFVEIPLRLRDPFPLGLLAMIVTATPGTAWLEYDSDSGILLLHVFDLIDDAAWRDLICNRYEALLLEVFA